MRRKIFPKDKKGRFFLRAGNRSVTEIDQAFKDEIDSDPATRAEFDRQCAENLAKPAAELFQKMILESYYG